MYFHSHCMIKSAIIEDGQADHAAIPHDLPSFLFPEDTGTSSSIGRDEAIGDWLLDTSLDCCLPELLSSGCPLRGWVFWEDLMAADFGLKSASPFSNSEVAGEMKKRKGYDKHQKNTNGKQRKLSKPSMQKLLFSSASWEVWLLLSNKSMANSTMYLNNVKPSSYHQFHLDVPVIAAYQTHILSSKVLCCTYETYIYTVSSNLHSFKASSKELGGLHSVQILHNRGKQDCELFAINRYLSKESGRRKRRTPIFFTYQSSTSASCNNLTEN